jgi:hypothetical protein
MVMRAAIPNGKQPATARRVAFKRLFNFISSVPDKLMRTVARKGRTILHRIIEWWAKTAKICVPCRNNCRIVIHHRWSDAVPLPWSGLIKHIVEQRLGRS